MNELTNIYELYKENNDLKEFTHLHFYPGENVGSGGIRTHKWIRVVGFDSKTMTRKEIGGRRDEIRPSHEWTGIAGASNLLKSKLDISQMGFWHDGSFFIKGNFNIVYVGQTLEIK